MTARDLILDILEGQSAIAGLDSQIKEADNKIKLANLAVNEAKYKKSVNLEAMANSKTMVEKANENLIKAEQALAEAEKQVTKAGLELNQAESMEAQFNPNLFTELDNEINEAVNESVKRENIKVELLSKLEIQRKDLDSKQKELKSLGYEFSFGAPKIVRTTSI